MFPWSPEFTWDATHVAFFGALYSVLLTVAGSLAVAVWRARRDALEGRAAAIAWHGDFEEMPASARACRHQLTGEAPGRVCENGFDCRPCAAHGHFEDLGRPDAPFDATDHFGFDLPLDRLYHRGHTWVRPEPDGTLTVGLDDLARRLVGTPERVELPEAGSRLQVNGPAGRLTTRGHDVRVLSPVDGTVVAVRGEGASATLCVDPGGTPDLRHLLSGSEARAWALRELERLQRALGSTELGAALADGGELVADVGAALPRDRYDALLGDMLLEP
ncbi:MAG TPA: glycine cleavage system protein H [Vicinamibacteria bacterium]|nr:glycine cleavage system protein H [Vicinamibacteria bacterium]